MSNNTIPTTPTVDAAKKVDALMRVAHDWANEPDPLLAGRSDALKNALREALAPTVDAAVAQEPVQEYQFRYRFIGSENWCEWMSVGDSDGLYQACRNEATDPVNYQVRKGPATAHSLRDAFMAARKLPEHATPQPAASVGVGREALEGAFEQAWLSAYAVSEPLYEFVLDSRTREYVRFEHRAGWKIFQAGLAASTQPLPRSMDEPSSDLYTPIFQSIASATKIEGGGIGVSVAAFKAELARRGFVVAAQSRALDAPSDEVLDAVVAAVRKVYGGIGEASDKQWMERLKREGRAGVAQALSATPPQQAAAGAVQGDAAAGEVDWGLVGKLIDAQHATRAAGSITGTSNWGAAIARVAAQHFAAPHPQLLRELARGRDGFKAHAEQLQRDRDHQQEKIEAMLKHTTNDVWYWQGDGQDHPESFGNSMVIVMRGEHVRDILAIEKNTELTQLRKALVYVANGLHSAQQYMLIDGITLIDGDQVTVKVASEGIDVDTGRVEQAWRGAA